MTELMQGKFAPFCQGVVNLCRDEVYTLTSGYEDLELKNGSNTLVCNLCLDSGDPQAIEVAIIEVKKPYRGKGLASKLLSQLCAVADRTNQRLVLSANPYEFDLGTPEHQAMTTRLIQHYSRFGFLDDDYGNMTRDPQTLCTLELIR